MSSEQERGVHAVNRDYARYDQVTKSHTYHLAETDGDEVFDDQFEVRTCDLSQYLDGDATERERFAHDLGSALAEIGFAILVIVMLAVDLGVFHKKAHEVSVREAGIWSCVWIGRAVTFNLVIYLGFGRERGLEFTTAYVIEKALSVDNIFVFIVVFATFAVPATYHHRVLFWGILGALVMRGLFIGAGTALLARFHWVVYIFGAILILSGGLQVP